MGVDQAQAAQSQARAALAAEVGQEKAFGVADDDVAKAARPVDEEADLSADFG